MSPVELIDSINCPAHTRSPIPQAILNAQSIGAYSAGNSWQTYDDYADARPDLDAIGWIVTITLTCTGFGRCYDIEPGGGSNANIGRFMAIADRKWGLPWLYTYASNTAAMTAAAARFGYHQGEHYYVWSAHQGKGRHICAPDVCGYPRADGTQCWYPPENCDGSLINDYMLPAKTPIATGDDDMITFMINAAHHDEYGVATADGEVKHIWKTFDAQSKLDVWNRDPGGALAWESLGHPGSPIVGITSCVNQNGHDEYGVRLADGTVKHLWKADNEKGVAVWNRNADGSFAWETLGAPK